MPKSELRKDYFLDQYVLITPGRAARPRDIVSESIVKKMEKCIFCPENIKPSSIIDKINGHRKTDWSVAALKNKYPAITLDNPAAYGVQEVIIDTPQHGVDLAHLPEKHLVKLLKMYRRRTEELAKIKDLEYILVFKNHGGKAGASIWHAHSQVFATNLLPPDISQEAQRAQAYKIKHGICPYCDIIKKEIKGPRKIFADRQIVAIAPYASRFHYEAWIFTHRHLDNITQLNKREFESLAKILKPILEKIHKLNLSYNYFIHQVISNPNQHFYLKIQPRESVWAGIELGAGIVINSVPPEVAAKFYRK